MRLHTVLILLSTILMAVPPGSNSARAQERVVVSTADAERSVQVETADPILAPPSIRTERGRFDSEATVTRARYRIETSEFHGGDSESVARAYLEAHRLEFGLDSGMADLRRDYVKSTSHSRHVNFRQTRNGIPVLGGNVKVNLDGEGRPTMVISNYRPHVADAEIESRRLSADDALERAAARAGGRFTLVGEPELVIYPSDAPRIAWHIIARPPDDSAEWSILIDAVSGESIRWIDQSVHVRTDASIPATHQPTTDAMTAHRDVEVGMAVDGTGSVFDPDPLTTAGVAYGPPYINANDADIPELNAQRTSVVLRDIALGDDGQYRLEGPYVRIVPGTEIGAPYLPPVMASRDDFHFGRSNNYFEAVNAYYHIDKSQRYIQEIDPQLDIHRFPIRVNPHGMGAADNSQYRPASNVLLFGTGGIDDAEDAHVILHEYGHALLQASAPGLLSTVEGQALHEGWSDYWAVSYTRELIESGQVPHRDWRKVFTWDGNETWDGRRLDHAGIYPEDAPCSFSSICNIWEDGRLWATTLMEVYSHLGRRTTDHLNLLSHAYLTAPATMQDAAEAILQADQDHYGGAHLSILLDAFLRRGFVGAGQFAPHIVHIPPASTEDSHGTLHFAAEVTSESSRVDDVRIIFVHADDEPVSFPLLHQGESIFAADIPIGGQEGELAYYVEAADDAGQSVRYPGAAPDEVFTVEVGPDRIPPVINHDPPAQINIADWPAVIVAEVTDRMGVESVRVEFELIGGVESQGGEFELESQADLYEGSFPPLDLRPGSTVAYRIVARDKSIAGNEAVLPAEGTFSIDITSGSVVRYYSFEGETNEGVVADEVWERGTPTFGTSMAWSGNAVWGTVLDGTYPEVQMLSSLRLPRVTVAGASEAYLVFWHWYDMEHDGRAYPERDGPATLWDGGNIKVSVDEGITWEVVVPEGGYSGRISDAYDNPLGAEMGFGGFSRGWRREVVPLPVDEDLLIRFDFGTDAANSEVSQQFAGWYIDDVEIRMDRPLDQTDPVFVDLPEATLLSSSDASHPPARVTARVEDDTGVAAVKLYSQLYDASNRLVQRDRFALDMSADDRTSFSVDFRPTADIEPGYMALYQLHAWDFDENEVWATSGGDGFQVQYLHFDSESVLDEVVQTGLWTAADNRWVTAWRHDAVEKSSLLIRPLDLPIGAAHIELHLDHQYVLGDGIGGNVKISADDGRTWSILTPIGGYDADFSSSGHEMTGESIFAGTMHDVTRSVFDLREYEGQQIRIRLDYGATRAATQDDWWSIDDALLSVIALDEALPVERELSLHTVYPNPFSSTITISYTLPEDAIILLEVYDALGRRIDVIRYALRLAGTDTITYDGSGLSAGVYFLSLKVDDRREVQTMVRMR